jgi:hypothetical protein
MLTAKTGYLFAVKSMNFGVVSSFIVLDKIITLCSASVGNLYPLACGFHVIFVPLIV